MKITKEIQKKFDDYFDEVLKISNGGDFIQVIGTMGGDARTYRFYQDGSIYEK